MTTLNIKPNYSIRMHNGSSEVGVLDFNGPAMTFTGNAEESAMLLFAFIAESFEKRLEEERQAEREACAKVCDEAHELMNSSFQGAAAAIRARGNT